MRCTEFPIKSGVLSESPRSVVFPSPSFHVAAIPSVPYLEMAIGQLFGLPTCVQVTSLSCRGTCSSSLSDARPHHCPTSGSPASWSSPSTLLANQCAVAISIKGPIMAQKRPVGVHLLHCLAITDTDIDLDIGCV
jgi:hypothetical protein